MAQENANEIAKSYNGKSVASNGETNTLSGWDKYNDPDNLIILRANHHTKVHKGKLDITQEIKNNRVFLE